MTIQPDNRTSARITYLPLLLLFIVGSMIAFSVSLSKVVAIMGAPTLWLVSLSQIGAGLAVMLLAGFTHQIHITRTVSVYSIGAGAFLAVPTALSFLSVAHVGAGYVSLVYAFTILLTYVLSVVIGIDRWQSGKIIGVACGLTGGLVLSVSSLGTLGGGGWLIAASSIPLILAFGNVYRTKFWPTGAGAILLAGLALIGSGILTAILAIITEGAAIQLLWQRTDFTLLLLANLLIFATQFVFYFILQRIAGPTYLSQIGSVAAVLGVAIAFFAFNEAPPKNFSIVIALVFAGVAVFQHAVLRGQNTAQ